MSEGRSSLDETLRPSGAEAERRLFSLVGLAGFVGYRLEYNQRKSFLLDYSVEASRRKQREILNTMLPSFVVDQMINAPLNDDGFAALRRGLSLDVNLHGVFPQPRERLGVCVFQHSNFS